MALLRRAVKWVSARGHAETPRKAFAQNFAERHWSLNGYQHEITEKVMCTCTNAVILIHAYLASVAVIRAKRSPALMTTITTGMV